MSILLRNRVAALTSNWRATGLPGRTQLSEIADALLQWREENNIPGLWEKPLRIMGATVDDALGMGIELILKYARAIGAETYFLGLRVPCQDIVAAARIFRPDYLGLTVLHFETEDEIKLLREQLPASVKLIAGGPVFKCDPDLQQRIGIDFVAGDLVEFLNYMLDTAA